MHELSESKPDAPLYRFLLSDLAPCGQRCARNARQFSNSKNAFRFANRAPKSLETNVLATQEAT